VLAFSETMSRDIHVKSVEDGGSGGASRQYQVLNEEGEGDILQGC
jgi:hypothetical protein